MKRRKVAGGPAGRCRWATFTFFLFTNRCFSLYFVLLVAGFILPAEPILLDDARDEHRAG